MSETIRCQATMTKFNVNVKKEDIWTCFSLQVMEDTSVRTFPRQFNRIDLGVFDSVANNDVFDKINVPCDDYNLQYTMDFEDLQFDVKLESISAAIKHTKTGTPYTVYNLNFVKEIEKEVDLKLASFVKYKEEDPESGKKITHLYRNGVEVKPMTNTQNEMGKISNLISDMTLLGADDRAIARAVRHSMVVIDAEKHGLDYEQSAIDNGIEALKKEWQIGVDRNGNVKYGGASTIISKASGQDSQLKTQGSGKINVKGEPWYDPTRPEGSLIFNVSNDVKYAKYKVDKEKETKTYYTEDGKRVTYNYRDPDQRAKYAAVKVVDSETGEVTFKSADGQYTYKSDVHTQKTTKMANTDDAYSLVSKFRNPMELLYADYAQYMKDLANQARLSQYNAGKMAYDPEAKKTYAAEVKSLDDKLALAYQNPGREREAQRRANAEVDAKIKAYKASTGKDMSKEAIKKARQMAITKYREMVGSIRRRDRNIVITDNEWKAIQAGAISSNKLQSILNNSDPDVLRSYATPRSSTSLTSSQIARIRSKASGSNPKSIAEIAEDMGLSVSTVSKYLNGGK